jgi:hypothetical protein
MLAGSPTLATLAHLLQPSPMYLFQLFVLCAVHLDLSSAQLYDF